jgi:transcriptional regulator with XRE-family HTH domain
MSTKKEKRLPVLGKRLNQLRGEMSQAEFAKKVGVAAATIGYYENSDRLPDAEMLRKICEACNVSCDYLLGITDTKKLEDSDIPRKTGLAPEAVEVLKLLAEQTGLTSFFSEFFEDPENLTTADYEIKAINHLVANCNRILADIGLYLFGDMTGVEKVKIRGAKITLGRADEFVRNGLLHSVTAHLAEYRKRLIENGGDLPLTFVLDATREAMEADRIEQRTKYADFMDEKEDENNHGEEK